MTDIASAYAKAQSEACDEMVPLSESNLFLFGGSLNWLLDRRASSVVNYALSSGGALAPTTIAPADPTTDISGSSVSYTTHGGLILVAVVPDGTTNAAKFGGQIQVLRDGSVISRRDGTKSPSSGAAFSWLLTIDSSVSAGSHTWKLQYGGWQSSGNINTAYQNVKTLVLEVY